MKPSAIVYTSNTGYTAEYARMLGEKTGLPVWELASRQVPKGSDIVYLGWLMAGNIQGYKMLPGITASAPSAPWA